MPHVCGIQSAHGYARRIATPQLPTVWHVVYFNRLEEAIMKRRIIRADSLNWAIQEWQEGGELIERGRFKDQVKKAKWKMPEVYFRTLAHAARDLFYEIVADGFTGEQIAKLVDDAEKRTIAQVSSMIEAQKTDMLIGILQERGYTVTDGKKGRKTLADDEAPDENNAS